ncbi:MAG: nucleoside 2-deoxyribosyltransferase [Deltaproteobacteria bacterium]|nr:nucleoside 2-deoxyribosyltransferase [Deltaproteobacteria bacterium]MBW2354449.1 nucleoside 2-deoxyribosyltransferase [Deltaproteobacteria bacterium]
MEEELLDIIDEDNQVVGKATKTDAHRQGLKHRVGAVLLKRKDGRYLIPTASELKVEKGLLYHSAAGHVLSGESYGDAARRELLEETGVMAGQLKQMGYFWFQKDYPTRKERERFEIYKAAYSHEMGPVRLNEEQVNETWLHEAELKEIYNSRPEKLSGPLKMTCRSILNNRKKRIYFAGSIRGGRGDADLYAGLIEHLSHFGKVLTEHVGNSKVVESEEGLSDQEIFNRDMDWLQSSDLVIAEVSTPSLGVGYEIGMAQAYGKKVLCLFRREKETVLSAMIAGNPNIKVQGYQTSQEAKELISAFLDSI